MSMPEKSKTNHPNTRLLRKVFMKRMILSAFFQVLNFFLGLAGS